MLVGLRAPRLGTRVIDVLDGQVKLVFVAFGLARSTQCRDL